MESYYLIEAERIRMDNIVYSLGNEISRNVYHHKFE